jgi:ABC-type amino acid transport substrate-binding protein
VRRGGTLRAGVAEHAPWVTLRDREPAGIEPQLLREFARALGARVAWTPGPEAELIDALARGELDVVASGLTRSTAWGDHVALTRPYRTTRTAAGRRREHVLAVPPGENGWLREVERFLAARGGLGPAR